MAGGYGALVRKARKAHIPPISSKELAQQVEVKPPFITDIEKGRRLPALDKQKKIKRLLSSEAYPEELFDDLAAADNEDTRIVAEDLARAIRKSPEVRNLLRAINDHKLSASQIKELTAAIGGHENAAK